MVEARKEKIKELSEAKNNAKDKSYTSSLRDIPNSSLHEVDNNLNNKQDPCNYSDYKLDNSLLDFIIEFLKNR